MGIIRILSMVITFTAFFLSTIIYAFAIIIILKKERVNEIKFIYQKYPNLSTEAIAQKADAPLEWVKAILLKLKKKNNGIKVQERKLNIKKVKILNYLILSVLIFILIFSLIFYIFYYLETSKLDLGLTYEYRYWGLFFLTTLLILYLYLNIHNFLSKRLQYTQRGQEKIILESKKSKNIYRLFPRIGFTTQIIVGFTLYYAYLLLPSDIAIEIFQFRSPFVILLLILSISGFILVIFSFFRVFKKS
ncbi:MAG: hypothetical protein ACFFHD_12650 [Promethearchaeota archaeon]